jgi:sugar phosphate isomerase/epimerase
VNLRKGFHFCRSFGVNELLNDFSQNRGLRGKQRERGALIRNYSTRVTHVHIKDRKFNNGPNTPFGQGDTPIVETLRLIRDNHLNIQATIEFEYKVPAGSDRNTELVKTIKFCKDALVKG